ncbi:MAG: Spx/MgsR family RNA polymerase-binding regulatory protein [Culicoidibacterales bacterium]
MLTIYYYNKCSTCRSAIKFLRLNNILSEDIDYTENIITYDTLADILTKSGSDVKKMFNTSGIIYRKLNLKDKLPNMTLKEKLELLAQNPMLIKRPLLVMDDAVLFGFKESEWISKLIIEQK